MADYRRPNRALSRWRFNAGFHDCLESNSRCRAGGGNSAGRGFGAGRRYARLLRRTDFGSRPSRQRRLSVEQRGADGADRANWHKFHRRDSDDQGDPWFRSDGSRADPQRMLERGGAMSNSTRRAIVDGEPLIEVDVYSDSVRVSIVED